MNTIEIIALLAVIAIGILYYFKFQEVKKLKQEKDDAWMKEKFWQQEHKYASEQNQKLSSELLNANSELNKCKDNLEALNLEEQRLLDSLANLRDERDALKTELEYHHPEDSTQLVPVRQTDFPYSFQADIDWGTINLSIKDLIGDDKLLEVFNSLVKSNLLPESIKDSIDYEPKEQICYIWTNTHDEEGDTISSLSWKGITNQILTKKQIVTDYLRGVIQDSDRAMVVHMALTSKPKKEVANG